jgi:pyridinium-3,5-biscarboxylic acid mononucleotide synthase
MDKNKIKHLLASVKDGSVPIEEALRQLKHLPYEDISFAQVDHHRHLRQGVPEVIFASGKTVAQVLAIARA